VFRKAGVYYIICNEYCGLMHQAMVTPIVVDPAPAPGSDEGRAAP
jgi:cytochrome c oxidase subunit 2